jgi:uncharacterized protein Yka (UPF0111/DUF47 family)
MGGKPLNNELYEKVVTDRLVFGKPAAQIAKEIERTDSTVYCVVKAFEAVRDQDWDRAIEQLSNHNTPLSPYEWAAQKLNIELPASLGAAYEERMRKAVTAKRDLKERRASQEAAKAEEPIKEEPKKEDNTALYLLKLLEAVNRQNELLEQLYDVVIPKWTGDIKDNINCNSDVISQSLKRIDDKLEAIKINVRKRGM